MYEVQKMLPSIITHLAILFENVKIF